MNVIAKISCYFERSVVTLKLREECVEEFSDMQYTNLTPDKILNSFVYRALFYVNIYTGVTNFQITVRFLATLYSRRILRFIYSSTALLNVHLNA